MCHTAITQYGQLCYNVYRFVPHYACSLLLGLFMLPGRYNAAAAAAKTRSRALRSRGQEKESNTNITSTSTYTILPPKHEVDTAAVAQAGFIWGKGT